MTGKIKFKTEFPFQSKQISKPSVKTTTWKFESVSMVHSLVYCIQPVSIKCTVTFCASFTLVSSSSDHKEEDVFFFSFFGRKFCNDKSQFFVYFFFLFFFLFGFRVLKFYGYRLRLRSGLYVYKWFWSRLLWILHPIKSMRNFGKKCDQRKIARKSNGNYDIRYIIYKYIWNIFRWLAPLCQLQERREQKNVSMFFIVCVDGDQCGVIYCWYHTHITLLALRLSISVFTICIVVYWIGHASITPNFFFLFSLFVPQNFMWNTITVQYNPLIEEEFDEHFKVTCEYGYDFWKTVTFPFLDVE